LSGYLFPCLPSSPFALSREDVECPSPRRQLEDTLAFLAAHQVQVARTGSSEEKKKKKKEEEEKEAQPTLRRLYLDIEDESTAFYFDPDPAVNQQFVAELVAAAAELGVPLGFYTTSSYWDRIMGGTEEYSEPRFPLWYPRWDGAADMDFFVPFGGWGGVQTKQTGGDVGLCGVQQVDLDFMLHAPASQQQGRGAGCE
jgi:hypothetical protein